MGLYQLGESIRWVLVLVFGAGLLGCGLLIGIIIQRWREGRGKPTEHRLIHSFEGTAEGRCPLCDSPSQRVREDVVSGP